MMQKRSSMFPTHVNRAKTLLRKAEGMYVGNLQYWLGDKTKRGKISKKMFDRVVTQLIDDGYVIEGKSVFKKGSKKHKMYKDWEAKMKEKIARGAKVW